MFPFSLFDFSHSSRQMRATTVLQPSDNSSDAIPAASIDDLITQANCLTSADGHLGALIGIMTMDHAPVLGVHMIERRAHPRRGA